MMFSNVIVGITISRHSFVISQSCLEVPVSLSDEGGLVVGALDPVNRSLPVVRFVLVVNVPLKNASIASEYFMFYCGLLDIFIYLILDLILCVLVEFH